MSRRRAATKRTILPDPKYGDFVVSKFVNALMEDGKKSVAEGILYGSLTHISGKVGRDSLEIFKVLWKT
jgi:small subunit ribosomal protein S7